MKLGTEELTEVWLMPSDHAKFPRLIDVFATVDGAREYIAEEGEKYAGTLEIVLVTTARQRVTTKWTI